MAAPEKNIIIKVEGVRKSFKGPLNSVINALSDINLTVREGEFVALIGPSGSGKTTLLQLIGSLLRPEEGEISVNGQILGNMSQQELSAFRNQYIGFIFQSFHLQPDWTCRENVMLPLLFREQPVIEAAAVAGGLLTAVGLGDYINHKPGQLSGGQKQRVAIARAMVTRPPILLADEPTGNLDPKTGGDIIKLISDLHRKRNTTVIIATHDEAIAQIADNRLYLRDGRISDENAR